MLTGQNGLSAAYAYFRARVSGGPVALVRMVSVLHMRVFVRE